MSPFYTRFLHYKQCDKVNIVKKRRKRGRKQKRERKKGRIACSTCSITISARHARYDIAPQITATAVRERGKKRKREGRNAQ